jgi:hypothetical protein
MMTQASRGNRPTDQQKHRKLIGIQAKGIMPNRYIGKKEQKTIGTKHRHLETQTNRGTGIS